MSRPYPCVYCTEDGYCKKYSDERVTSWCVQGPCEDEKPSNADRIRAMTDEELAEWIAHPKISYCQYDICDGETDCAVCALDWLKQEASE